MSNEAPNNPPTEYAEAGEELVERIPVPDGNAQAAARAYLESLIAAQPKASE